MLSQSRGYWENYIFRIMEMILQTFHLTTQHSNHQRLPHHIRLLIIKETVQLLIALQLSDNIIIGMLVHGGNCH